MCPFYFEKNLLYPFYFEKKLLCAFPFYFEKKLLCACSFYFKKTSYTPFISKKNSYVPAPFLTALDSYLLSGSSILELLFPKHTASVLSYSVKVRDRSKLTGYIGRVLGKICLKQSLRPPNFFFEKKSSPPCRWSRPGYPINFDPSLRTPSVG